jgi:hypothetical protein
MSEQVKPKQWTFHESGARLEGYGEGDECLLTPAFPPSPHGSLFLLQARSKGQLMWEICLGDLQAANSLAANWLIAITMPPGEDREKMLLQAHRWRKALDALSDFVESQTHY